MLYGSGQRIRTRHVGHGDLEACLGFLPPWLPLDAKTRAELTRIWTRLLWQPAFNADLIEDVSLPPGERTLGVGMAIALDLEWQARLRSDPPTYVAAEMYRALGEGRYVPPNDRQLAVMNREGKVAFLVLHYGQRLTDLNDPDAVNLLAVAMGMFRWAHAGYRLDALYQEGFGIEQEYLSSMGFRPMGPVDVRLPPHDAGANGVPRLFGLERSQASLILPGSPVRDAFQFTPPLLGFSPAERRLLRLAVSDMPDDSIAQELGITGHTVKKTWREIHDRVGRHLPHVYSDPAATAAWETTGTRGPEKRRWVLQYLRQHPEELRPYEFTPLS